MLFVVRSRGTGSVVALIVASDTKTATTLMSKRKLPDANFSLVESTQEEHTKLAGGVAIPESGILLVS